MQQVIVYRNPAEAAFWEFIMSSNNVFPIVVGAVIGVVLCVFFDLVIRKNVGYVQHSRFMRYVRDYGALVIGAVVWFLVSWYLWL